jgi:hypothetical protein
VGDVAFYTKDAPTVRKVAKLGDMFAKTCGEDERKRRTMEYALGNIRWLAESTQDQVSIKHGIDITRKSMGYSEAIDHFTGMFDSIRFLKWTKENARKACRALNQKEVFAAIDRYSDDRIPSKYAVTMYNQIACELQEVAFRTGDSKLVKKLAEVAMKCEPKIAEQAIEDISCSATRNYSEDTAVAEAHDIADGYLRPSKKKIAPTSK